MLTYDPKNPRSAEAPALIHMADLLSKCEYWQELCEQSGAFMARAKIKTGVQFGPDDGDSFSMDELQTDFCMAHLIWPIEGGRVLAQDDGGPSPLEGGDIHMTIRRHVRESEVDNLKTEGGLDIAFLDVISALEQEIMAKAEVQECPRLLGIEREGGPAFNSLDEESAQGNYLWVKHIITWGDAIEE